MDKGKQQALDQALKDLRKRLGESSIMLLGETDRLDIEVIPSGSLVLDIALGVGGYPRGRVTEIYGPEGCGKTTVALHAIAEAQRMGEVAAFIDVENALDVEYATKIGVDVDSLYVSQPDSGEHALDVVDTLVRSNAVGIVVVDSVAALVPEAELTGSIGASLPAIQARLMSQFLRRVSKAVSQSNVVLLFINQIRYKVGVMFGNPETTSGGVALKFYSTVRLDCRKGQPLKRAAGEIFGHRLKIKTAKNKVAPPFRKVEVNLIYGIGFSKESDLLDLAVEHNIMSKTGSHHFTYGDIRMGHGKTNAEQFLSENYNIAAEIETKVREVIGLVAGRPQEDAPPVEPED